MFVVTSTQFPQHANVAPRVGSAAVLSIPSSRRRRRRIIWAVLMLSCVPYFLPEKYQPYVYRDGKTPDEIRLAQRERHLNRVLGGDLRSTELGKDVLDNLVD